MRIDSNIEEIRKSNTDAFPTETLVEVEDKDIKNGIFEVPSEVSEIGKFCFYKCQTLKKVNFPNLNKYIIIDIGAFYQTNIEEFIYDDDMILSANAFRECKNLKIVSLPKKGVGIGFSVFYGCTSLKKIKLSDSIKAINNSTFYGCSSLTNLTLSKSIEYIGNYAFEKCSSLDLVIETSLFSIEKLSLFKSTFDVKKLTIYNNEINLDDSIENIIRKIKTIRKKELDTLVRSIIHKNNLNINDISKQDLDKIEEKKQDLLKELCNYKVYSFKEKITEIVKKYQKNLPALSSYNLFISKSTEEIYSIINDFNTNIVFKTLDDIQKYGSELVFFPTYITSSYLNFVRTRNDYNETIIKMKDVIDKLTMNSDKQSLIKKIFLRRNSKKNKLELNTEFINDLNDFIDINEVNLREELMFLENLKKLLEIFINKLQNQIEFILNYNNETLSSDSQIVLSGKLNNLKTSLCLMKDINDKIGILGASNIVIYDKLELLKNTILPKIIIDLVIDNKIERNENTINALNSFSKTLEEVIVLNENNKEILKIDTSISATSDEKDYSKKKLKA